MHDEVDDFDKIGTEESSGFGLFGSIVFAFSPALIVGAIACFHYLIWPG